jgi:hypothetical protein
VRAIRFPRLTTHSPRHGPLARRWLDLDGLLVREADVLRASRVLLEPLFVEHGGEVLHALLDCLALLARGREGRDETVHVVERDLVDASIAKVRQYAVERDPVQDAGSLGDVDAALAPALDRFGESRCAGGFLLEQAHVRDAESG